MQPDAITKVTPESVRLKLRPEKNDYKKPIAKGKTHIPTDTPEKVRPEAITLKKIAKQNIKRQKTNSKKQNIFLDKPKAKCITIIMDPSDESEAEQNHWGGKFSIE